MDAKDRTERELDHNSICRLEWIAWAMEAARRHKEAEHLAPSPQADVRTLDDDDD
jgi:hypothetical protein